MREREASGITVEVLDKAYISGAAMESLKQKGQTKKLKSHGEVGIVRTKKGIFVLDNEGIHDRHPMSKTNRWPIDLYAYRDDDGMSMDMIPLMVINIGPDELKHIPIKETKPLEEFVRKFGARLEANYELCREHLTKQMK